MQHTGGDRTHAPTVSRRDPYNRSYFRATLSASRQGSRVALPFPIDEDEMMEHLAPLAGEMCRRFILEDIEWFPELEYLRGSEVDVDDLNFLAKRMDSFWEPEMQTFEAVVETEPGKSLPELITLTHDLSNYLLVESFQDTRRLGMDIAMAKNGGHAKTGDADYDGTPYVQRAKELEQYPCKMSRHGPLYKIGEHWEEPYDGILFPGYLWRLSDMMGLSAKGGGEEKIFWMQFPAADAYLQSAAMRLGADSPDDLRIAVVEDGGKAFLDLGGERDVRELPPQVVNRLYQKEQNLHLRHPLHLLAAVELSGASGPGEIDRLLDNMDAFPFVPGVTNVEEYGEHIMKKRGSYLFDEEVDKVGGYNYAAIGEASADRQGGSFTSFGYVYYTGSIPIKDLLRVETQEQVKGAQELTQQV